MSVPESIRHYVQSPPMAGCGQNFHDWLMGAANKLAKHVYQNEAFDLLMAAGRIAGRSDPAEVRNTINKAYAECGAAYIGNDTWKRPDGETFKREPAWPSPDLAAVLAVTDGGPDLNDLRQLSPVKFKGEGPHSEEVVDELFPGNPWLCPGKTQEDNKVFSREKIRGSEHEFAYIVPNPMHDWLLRKDNGGFSGRLKDNVKYRRFLVTEFDFSRLNKHGNLTPWAPIIDYWKSEGLTPKDAMASIIAHLSNHGPLVMVVDSMGKSLHAWWRCPRGASEERTEDNSLYRFFLAAVLLGADHRGWVSCQFMRMPDGTRDKGENKGKRQSIIYFDPEKI